MSGQEGDMEQTRAARIDASPFHQRWKFVRLGCVLRAACMALFAGASPGLVQAAQDPAAAAVPSVKLSFDTVPNLATPKTAPLAGDPLTLLIRYLNHDLDLAEVGVRIDDRPEPFSKRDLRYSAANGKLQIGFLTPLVYASAKVDRPSLLPIAMLRLGDDREDHYRGRILYNPSTVDWKLLHPIESVQRPRLAVLPLSAWGELLPQIELLKRLGLEHEDLGVLQDHLDYVVCENGRDIIQRFFSLDEASRVDIAPINESELSSWLDRSRVSASADDANPDDLVHQWFSHFHISEPSSLSTNDIVTLLGHDSSEVIPSEVLVIDTGDPSASRLKDPLTASLSRLDASLETLFKNADAKNMIDALASGQSADVQADRKNLDEQITRLLDGAASKPGADLVVGLRKRNFTGFKTDSVLNAYAPIAAEATEYRPSQYADIAFSAGELVRDISNDIKIKKRSAQRRRDARDYQARIAVVLSGGGASGAYEAGALSSFLEALAAEQQRLVSLGDSNVADEMKVDLFVGTSVGALNGLIAATTRATDVPKKLNDLWGGINSESVLRSPGRLVDLRLLLFQWTTRHSRWVGLLLLGLALTAQVYTLLVLSAISTRVQGIQRWLVPVVVIAGALAWAYLARTNAAFGIGASALLFAILAWIQRHRQHPLSRFVIAFLLVVGGILLGVAYTRSWSLIWLGVGALLAASAIVCVALPGGDLVRSAHDRQPRVAGLARVGRYAVLAFIFIILPFGCVEQLFDEQALFEPDMLEKTMVRTLGGTPDETLPELSRKVSGQIQTPLVVSATDFLRLKNESVVVPGEVYFYSQGARPPAASNSGPLWIPISANPDLLLDMVVGSAAIFPGLPPHRITGVRHASNDSSPLSLDLIDGGYLHNIPVDAAAQCGATHIIVIQVQPEYRSDDERSPDDPGTLRNLYDVVMLLHQRAQAIDSQALQSSRCYRIAPKSRLIETLDFDGAATPDGHDWVTLKAFFDDGRHDAQSHEAGFRLVSLGE